jgi:hypothetical protein
VLNQIQLKMNPPRPGFKGRLFDQLMDHPLGQTIVAVPGHQNCLLCSDISTLGLPPADGPNTSGPKPAESSPASQAGGPPPLTLQGTVATDSSSCGWAGSDTRGRVQTIGLTPSSTPAQPGEPTSTAADGSSGRAGRDAS